MLSHVTYITQDSGVTADFYSRILKMELVNAVTDDTIPSTGEPLPYFHTFFRMGDGSTIAFFEAPELAPLEKGPHPAHTIFRHLALQVDSVHAVDAWHEWLTENGVEVIGPIDHKIIYSIYFHDPDGGRLEITTPTSPDWNDNAETAKGNLADWQALKEDARSAGRDVSGAVVEFTLSRSHKRG
jgi:catechol 2,3-dioxygenase-like lactoylglutathione lyase family enzyme